MQGETRRCKALSSLCCWDQLRYLADGWCPGRQSIPTDGILLSIYSSSLLASNLSISLSKTSQAPSTPRIQKIPIASAAAPAGDAAVFKDTLGSTGHSSR